MIPKNWPDSVIKGLCALLKERRLAANISIYRLSRDSGISELTITNLESFRKRPSIDTIIRVASALGLKASEALALAEARAGTPKTETSKGAHPKSENG